jgi:hypothetical protein
MYITHADTFSKWDSAQCIGLMFRYCRDNVLLESQRILMQRSGIYYFNAGLQKAWQGIREEHSYYKCIFRISNIISDGTVTEREGEGNKYIIIDNVL